MGLFPPSPGGGKEVAHGYKGKGSLIHLLEDRLGHPISITTTAANGNERKEVEKLLDRVDVHLAPRMLQGRMIVLEADRGYDCGWLRQALLIRNTFPLIPHRKIPGRDLVKTEEICSTFYLSKTRWVVERAFARLKRRCRRLLLHWERLPEIWSGFATLGLVYTWVKNLVG
jgi:transposase